MSWKEVAEQRSLALETERQTVRRLENQLAGLSDQNPMNRATETQLQQLIAQLQQDVKAARQNESAAEATLANVFHKCETIENELDKEQQRSKELQQKIVTKDNELERAQQAFAESAPVHEIQALKAENATLKVDKERLTKQLQVEKAENAGRLGWSVNKPGRMDQDDEEIPLSSYTTRAEKKPSLPVKLPFRQPIHQEKLTSILNEKTDDAIGSQGQSKSTTSTTIGKRKRTKEDVPDDELADLRLPASAYASSPRRKRPATNTATQLNEGGFDFRAITEYHHDGIPSYFRSQSQNLKVCEFLFDRVKLTKDVWESKKGAAWELEYDDTKTASLVCVTSKLSGKRAKLRRDANNKPYACKDCAKHGRPCFIWAPVSPNAVVDSWTDFEFKLLPIHKNDRTVQFDSDNEVRWWLNDTTKFSAKDVMGEDDDDYKD